MFKTDNKIEELKQLLLDTDLDKLERIDKRLKEVVQDLYVKERLKVHIDPIVNDQINNFQKTIPEKLGPSITAALKRQVKESQNEVVDALYPVLGKLIRKFIRMEIQQISDRIDQKFQDAFSWESWKRRLKAWLSGSKESELILQEISEPELEEMFMIEKESGLLIGKFSKSNLLDADMVAGMLTAIKSFAQDAFKKGEQELEAIDYEGFKIKLFNYQSFYVAVVLTGIVNASFLAKIQVVIDDFVELYLRKIKQKKSQQDISVLIKNYFDENDI